jgi:branched-chain amino acid transport system ATP-binding protein
MAEAIRSIAQTGVAILLVEQNLFLAEAVCTHAFIMESGAIVADGPTEQILKSNLVQDSYLGA